MVVSAEDCADMVTAEIVGLYDAWLKVNEGKAEKAKGRVFFAKAVVILARCRHSRDADELKHRVTGFRHPRLRVRRPHPAEEAHGPD
jgi:hypothetical protein